MRTFTSRTTSLACWVGFGLLSACTVTVNEGDGDDNDQDAAVTSGEETAQSSQPSDDGGAQATDSTDATETSDDGDTISVPLESDAGAVEADGGSVEGDGGDVPSDGFNCGSRDTDGATVVDDTIREDVTWSGTVYVTTTIDVADDVTVTIEPGTKIIMAVDSDIEFGWNGSAVTVDAEGTPERPITICGEEAEPGYWGSVTFGSNVTSNSTFKNVLVSDGGASEAAVRFGADVHVENLQVVGSGQAGVEAFDFAEDSSELSVIGARGAAVVLTSQDAFTNFPLGGVFEDNDDNHVVVDFTGIDGNDSVVVHDVGIPYLQESTMDVRDSVELVFEAGVVYRFASDADLEVGWNGTDPTLLIQGTEDAPVVFEGQASEPGYWGGLTIGSGVRSNSTIEHLTLRHAGAEPAEALSIAAAITLTHVHLEDNENGAWIGAQGLDPDSSNLSIMGTEGVPLTVEADALVSIPQGGEFTGNSDDVIAVDGTSYEASGTVADLGVPYRVLRSIDTHTDSSMTIEPGVVFEMTADTSIEFGWNSQAATVVAVGTEEAPIVFKGVDETPGAWAGIYVNNNVTSDSKFEYVTVEHAGNTADTEDGAAIYLDGAVAVSNCTFNDIAGYGVILDSEANAAIVVDNEFSGTTLGALLDLTD